MSQIEREIKILKVDVKKVKKVLKDNGISAKGKYIQDVYTFDLPSVDTLYIRYVNELITNNDNRGIIKLIKEIRPCFDQNDLSIIKNTIGVEELIDFIQNSNNTLERLKSNDMINIMKKTNNKFSKWVRLRKTGDETTLTIKKIVDSKVEDKLDAVEELEFHVPNIEDGKQFLEDLGYFFARHQKKMRIAYDYKNTEIVIDKWPLIDPYIEIEGPTKEEIVDAVKMLGFDLKDTIVINTDDVYLMAGIDIYDDEHKELSFNEEENNEVAEYLK